MTRATLSVMLMIIATLDAQRCAAQDLIIDFNGVGLNTNDPVSVDGFEFDYLDHDGWAIGIPGADLIGDFNNGTNIITVRDTFERDMTIRMTNESGILFSVQQFDTADIFLSANGGMNIEVTGFLNVGGTVTQSVSTVGGVYTTYNLPSTFNNLTAIEFHGMGTTGDAFVLDNIHVSFVPEPSSCCLLSVLCCGVMAPRRK